MSIINLYNTFGIPYQTEGHKHCTPGWVSTHCPFCAGSQNYHLGINLSTGTANCWRCGWHPTSKTISKLIGVDERTAKELIRKYHVVSFQRNRVTPSQSNQKIQFKPFKLPSDCGPLKTAQKTYLLARGFDPKRLEKSWGVLGAGPTSYLDKIPYKNRIIIPIYWEEKMVSFQGRAISDKTDLKYLACPKQREAVPHQTILYGKGPKDKAIIVEGVTDVWRLGEKAFAVFGIEFTHKQLRCIAKLFKEVVVLFDDDPQAVKQGAKLVDELLFRGLKARQEIIKGDPAGLSQVEADYLVKQLW